MKVAVILSMAVLFSACAKEKKAEENSPAPEKPSTVKTAIDGFTGKTAVKQGKKAQKQIEAISAKKNEELDEVM